TPKPSSQDETSTGTASSQDETSTGTASSQVETATGTASDEACAVCDTDQFRLIIKELLRDKRVLFKMKK
ncbi:hypothetical protein LSAT2_021552, partial [Lamellibrachia satsuma]